MPGTTLATNATGSPERVIAPHAGGSPSIEVNVAGSVVSERQLIEVVRSALYELKRANGPLGFAN